MLSNKLNPKGTNMNTTDLLNTIGEMSAVREWATRRQEIALELADAVEDYNWYEARSGTFEYYYWRWADKSLRLFRKIDRLQAEEKRLTNQLRRAANMAPLA